MEQFFKEALCTSDRVAFNNYYNAFSEMFELLINEMESTKYKFDAQRMLVRLEKKKNNLRPDCEMNNNLKEYIFVAMKGHFENAMDTMDEYDFFEYFGCFESMFHVLIRICAYTEYEKELRKMLKKLIDKNELIKNNKEDLL